jgi:hypothetical protein
VFGSAGRSATVLGRGSTNVLGTFVSCFIELQIQQRWRVPSRQRVPRCHVSHDSEGTVELWDPALVYIGRVANALLRRVLSSSNTILLVSSAIVRHHPLEHARVGHVLALTNLRDTFCGTRPKCIHTDAVLTDCLLLRCSLSETMIAILRTIVVVRVEILVGQVAQWRAQEILVSASDPQRERCVQYGATRSTYMA